jgi:hypothetical protein
MNRIASHRIGIYLLLSMCIHQRTCHFYRKSGPTANRTGDPLPKQNRELSWSDVVYLSVNQTSKTSSAGNILNKIWDMIWTPPRFGMKINRVTTCAGD